jgi:hypothetical protein
VTLTVCRLSSDGPNAGRFKPGVSDDGKAMTYLEYALVTDNMTITVSRFANHPLQLQVEITDRISTDPSGNLSEMSFQIDVTQADGEDVERKFCTQELVEDSGNITFDSMYLSFLGAHDGLRHWVCTTCTIPCRNLSC